MTGTPDTGTEHLNDAAPATAEYGDADHAEPYVTNPHHLVDLVY
jgi:hypothetical protein